MALFESRELKELRLENKVLRAEVSRLNREMAAIKNKYYDAVGRESEKRIADDLELTSSQKSKLGVIFSVERCRVAGVPEERIIHNMKEAEKFFTPEES